MKKSILLLAAKLLLVMFCLLPTFSFAQFTKLHDFIGNPDGSQPDGSLISDGNFLYGMTIYGGTNEKGVIFKIKSDGSGYSKLHDFGSGTDGADPANGSLIFDGTFLYGMTIGGGTNSFGTIFKIKPDGTGYTDLYDFNGIGSSPIGSLISDGIFLYGMTSQGGIIDCNNDGGIIFKIKLDGTGFSKLYDFNCANGNLPGGSLYSDGTFLYGKTQFGGSNNFGTIFKIKSDGTQYSVLHNFTGGISDGKEQGGGGSLISDGSFLYGMTYGGGANNGGIIFKIKLDGTGYLKLFDFTATSGAEPHGSLIFDGTFLYGLTTAGGNIGGVIFKMKTDGTGYSKLFNFGNGNGDFPYGSLYSDSTFFYGMTSSGGTNTLGTIFKLDITTAGIAKKNEINSFNIFPNPSNGTFTIATKENDYFLNITDVRGLQVYQSAFKNQKQEIDLSKQPNGIYFLNIQTEKGTTVQKLIINR